jgi:EmrB/QacA subfamily drug resistance transporter
VNVAAFPPAERGAAVGAWTAWSGIAYMVGPLVGGVLTDEVSWRLIFAINVPLVALTLVLIAKAVLETPREGPRPHVDVIGAILCAIGLAGPTFGLVRQPELGWGAPAVLVPIVAGAAVFAAFLAWERRSPRPMLPLGLFARRNFAAGNLQTLLMYGGLSITLFLLTLFLQEVAGYSAVEAGLATMPTTVVMFLLSRRMGALADRFGPRRFMGFGPLIAATGLLLYLRVGRDAPYATEVLPAILVFALGLSMTVAPLTAMVLADADDRNAGIASGINNAIARVAGLLGVALVGVLVGERLTVGGFHAVVALAAGLVAAGGVIGLLFVQDPQRDVPCEDCPGGAVVGAPAQAVPA